MVAAAAAGAALLGCAAEPQVTETTAPAPASRGAPAAAEPPPYVAALARPLGAYPQALLQGTFRIVDGCAMIDEDLLVLPAGSRGIVRPDGTQAALVPGKPPRELVHGRRIRGGGGAFPLDAFSDRSWPLAAPVPERCARIARGAQLISPLVAVYPPRTYAERLYAAVAREDLSPPPHAPLGGVLRVVDQCLLLGDDLLVLPANSWVQYFGDGRLGVRIARRGYGESVLGAPGDRIRGSGAGLMAEDESIPEMPRPLLEPIPARCRPPGRRGVVLNADPEVIRGGGSPHVDPGAGATLVVPPPPPPPPVGDPKSCPPGTRLSAGLCRRPDGSVVVVRERPPR